MKAAAVGLPNPTRRHQTVGQHRKPLIVVRLMSVTGPRILVRVGLGALYQSVLLLTLHRGIRGRGPECRRRGVAGGEAAVPKSVRHSSPAERAFIQAKNPASMSSTSASQMPKRQALSPERYDRSRKEAAQANSERRDRLRFV